MAVTDTSKSGAFHAGNADLDYDVLIVGAGLSGIFSLYRIRQLGLRVKVFEAGSGEGGTWFWYVLTTENEAMTS
jgi:cation diffusion facilitator CzcD-associated flavoprotein CzcO